MFIYSDSSNNIKTYIEWKEQIEDSANIWGVRECYSIKDMNTTSFNYVCVWDR